MRPSEDGGVPGSAFHTVILHKIPALSMERLPEVRRLITLIDVLYDHQVKVAPFLVRPRALHLHLSIAPLRLPDNPGVGLPYCGAAAAWWPRGCPSGVGSSRDMTARQVMCSAAQEPFKLFTADKNASQDEAFAFDRTASRLQDMMS